MAISSSLVSLLTLVGIFAILAIGLNIKFGYTGLLEIGHVVFYLIGAYTTALLVSPPASTQEFSVYMLGLSWPWPVALAAGTVVAGVFGVIVALPAIRLREDYLAIVMLGFSIIGMRIVQTERWIGNGPDSLSSYHLPLREFLPLPGDTVQSAILLGAVVVVVWSAATALLTRVGTGSRSGGLRGRVVRGLLAATSLGVGYAGARLARRETGSPDVRYVLGAGVVAGTVAVALTVVGVGELAVLLFFGMASLFGWVALGVLLARRFGHLSRVDALAGLGLAAGFVVALAPGVFGASAGGALAAGSLLVTLSLLGAYLYGLFALRRRWPVYRTRGSFLDVAAVVVVWLFLVRYFVLSVLGPLAQAGLLGAVRNTVQNVLWLVSFGPAGVQFDYSRFLLVLVFLALGGVYYVVELVVDSPYGRVLKAIREDETVTASLGKTVFSYKMHSMALGSMIAGFAGGLTAIYFRALTFNMFHPRVTFFVFLILIIGGAANNRGMILGSLIYWGFQKATGDIAALFPSGEMRTKIQALRVALFGLLFVFILYYRPEGLLPEGRTAGEPEVTDE